MTKALEILQPLIVSTSITITVTGKKGRYGK